MKINLEKGRLVIELPRESAELLVNGELQAEYFLGVPSGPEDLRGELRKANAAKAAASMLRGILRGLEKPKNGGTGKDIRVRRNSFTEGLVAGLTGEHRRLYPKDSGVEGAVVEPETPAGADHAAFRDGWQLGQGIFAAATMAETGEDPRADW